MAIAKWTVGLAAIALPLSASAEGGDIAYCEALAQSYQRYVVKVDAGHTVQRGALDGSVALEQCRAGNLAGIPVLERKLRDAGVELPPRG